jgi:AAA+ superfamily predicted ATPase
MTSPVVPMQSAGRRAKSDPIHDLELLIRSRYGLIVIDSAERERVETLARLVADRLAIPLFTWSRTKGLFREGAAGPVYGTTDAEQTLAHIEASNFDALYLLTGFETLLGNAALADRLREVAAACGTRAGALVLAATGLTLAEPLRRLSATVQLPPPELDEYRTLIDHLVRDLRQRMDVKVDISPAAMARLLHNLKGLTLLEAEKILTKAMVEDGRLADHDLAHVIEYKKQIVEREGVLEYYPVEESMAAVADLAGLKDWLRKRTHIITAPDRAAQFGLEFPKGLLLIGVPGCGKSLCARAVAMEWGLPLLKLDPGALYNKYIGESEKNFKRAMQTAERLAPCVLFIDELEKAFASGGEDGGVSQRVLGTFLSWLQDRRSEVFTVATANDVSKLPPEFLRKGRFDEVFFVDLPDAAARRAIADIHLRRRGHDPASHDLDAIVAASDGFSGAEIEQAIVSALYTAFADHGALTTDILLAEIRATRPLAVVMAERIQSLRSWAHGRTVRAN